MLFRIINILKYSTFYVLRARHANQLPLTEHKKLMQSFCQDMANTLGLDITVSGQVPKLPCLITPNHISWHDVFAIGISIAPNFVAKAEVEDWPVFGYLGKQGGTLFIERGNRHAARAISNEIRTRLPNRSILIFPEGTTSTGQHVATFKRRLFEPAIDLDATIQPVALHYYGTDYHGQPLGYGNESFAAHLWRTLRTPRIQIGVHYCEPFTPSELPIEQRNAHAVSLEAQKRVEVAKNALSEIAINKKTN